MTGDASERCCLFEAALDALTIPVVVQDLERILFANGIARTLLGRTRPVDVAGQPNNAFSLPDNFDAESERRRIVLQRGGRLRDVAVRVLDADGRVIRALADASPIAYPGGPAIVHTVRSVNGKQLAEDVPGADVASAKEAACMHEAAFDELTVPVVIQDKSRLLAGNRQARHVLEGDLAGRAIRDVMHPDFVDAAAERRELLLERGGTYHEAPGKLQTLTGKPVHGLFDGAVVSAGGTRAVVVTAKRLQLP